MRVEAVRDDGALLITDGPAGAVVAGGKAWMNSRDSILARGYWQPSTQPMPADAPADLAARLATRRRDLEARETPS